MRVCKLYFFPLFHNVFCFSTLTQLIQREKKKHTKTTLQIDKRIKRQIQLFSVPRNLWCLRLQRCLHFISSPFFHIICLLQICSIFFPFYLKQRQRNGNFAFCCFIFPSSTLSSYMDTFCCPTPNSHFVCHAPMYRQSPTLQNNHAREAYHTPASFHSFLLKMTKHREA